MFFNARWLDPALGRFAQADSIIPEASQGTQAWDRYAGMNNNPVSHTDSTGHMIDSGCNFEDCTDDPDTPNLNVADYWDASFYDSVSNPLAAEQAFSHYLADPQYFANLYANPEAWASSEEVANLDIFMQYSVFHITADSLMNLGLEPEVAGNLSNAHALYGVGDYEGMNAALLAAGAVPVGDLIAQAKAQSPKLADQWNWHHYTPQYLGGSANGPQYYINAAYHQFITNEFRRLYGYGKGLPSPQDLSRIINEVYTKYPIPPGSRMR